MQRSTLRFRPIVRGSHGERRESLYRTERWAEFLHSSHLTDGMILELIRQDPDPQFLIEKRKKRDCQAYCR